ncbi:nitroreductase family protein [Campylobacter sp.]|uniref:nitroreductase family protein n=1 Tax=Campylobacter sp. TaxID=205 RepID=UPI0027B8D95F|nr:nitroreductase family protein [Campylobacter sp.]
MEILEIFANRRSVRKYAQGSLEDEALDKILKAGLLAPSGHARRPWEFILVRDKRMLERLSACRSSGADMLKQAAAAIVVIADEQKQDVWIEDCSVALGYMHLAASTLNLGSCWVQVRLRAAADGRSCEEFLREALGFPPNFKAEAILVLGVLQRSPSPHDLQKLNLSKIHKEKF